MGAFKRFVYEQEDDFKVTHTGYHGTPDARGIMKDGFKTLKQRYGNEDHESIYWAAKDHKVAKTYADPHRAFDYQNSEPKVLPVEMHMNNPKHIDWEGRKFRGSKAEGRYNIHDHIEQARKEGHDGFVIHNVVDDYQAKGKPSTIMGVFDHNRIRVKK